MTFFWNKLMITFDCAECKRRTSYDDNHYNTNLEGDTICDICMPMMHNAS